MRCSMRSLVTTNAIKRAAERLQENTIRRLNEQWVQENPSTMVTNKVETNLDKAVLTISEQITTLQLYMVRRLDELDEGLATLQQSQDELAKAVEELADEVLTERRRWEEE